MEENFNKHLGNKLKLRRLALGLTQTKVAKAINVTAIEKFIFFYKNIEIIKTLSSISWIQNKHI